MTDRFMAYLALVPIRTIIWVRMGTRNLHGVPDECPGFSVRRYQNSGDRRPVAWSHRNPPGGGAKAGVAPRGPVISVHADQLCRQGGDRNRRRADHAGASTQPAPVRIARLELFLAVFGFGDRYRL